MKMRSKLLFGVFISTSILTMATNAADKEAANDLAMALQKDLGTVLMTAMMEDGPMAALHVCNLEAQDITANHDGDKAKVTRISHRNRNALNEVPEEFAEKYAELMDNYQASEGKAKAVDFISEGEQHISMRAIPTAQHCLVCHGGNIEPELKAEIDRLYPNDEAVDFNLGEMRGAFLIEWQE